MNIECLRKALKQHRTADISVGSGVCIATIESIKSGRNQYPTTRTVEKLRAFMEKNTNELPSLSQKSAT